MEHHESLQFVACSRDCVALVPVGRLQVTQQAVAVAAVAAVVCAPALVAFYVPLVAAGVKLRHLAVLTRRRPSLMAQTCRANCGFGHAGERGEASVKSLPRALQRGAFRQGAWRDLIRMILTRNTTRTCTSKESPLFHPRRRLPQRRANRRNEKKACCLGGQCLSKQAARGHPLWLFASKTLATLHHLWNNREVTHTHMHTHHTLHITHHTSRGIRSYALRKVPPKTRLIATNVVGRLSVAPVDTWFQPSNPAVATSPTTQRA